METERLQNHPASMQPSLYNTNLLSVMLRGTPTYLRRSAGGGYTGWHRDRPPYMHPSLSLFTKLFVYLDHVGPDVGCTALVPASLTIPGPLFSVSGPRIYFLWRIRTPNIPGVQKCVRHRIVSAGPGLAPARRRSGQGGIPRERQRAGPGPGGDARLPARRRPRRLGALL